MRWFLQADEVQLRELCDRAQETASIWECRSFHPKPLRPREGPLRVESR